MNLTEMIRVLRLELDRVDRCLMAVESLAGPKRGRPRKYPPPLRKRLACRAGRPNGSTNSNDRA